MGKKIDIIYEDKKVIDLKDCIAEMIDNGLAVRDISGGVRFVSNVRIIAGKQED